MDFLFVLLFIFLFIYVLITTSVSQTNLPAIFFGSVAKISTGLSAYTGHTTHGVNCVVVPVLSGSTWALYNTSTAEKSPLSLMWCDVLPLTALFSYAHLVYCEDTSSSVRGVCVCVMVWVYVGAHVFLCVFCIPVAYCTAGNIHLKSFSLILSGFSENKI